MNKRIKYLDGIRGVMALNVVINHFVVIYFPQMYFMNYAKTEGGFLSLFATTPLSVLVNGNIAVQFFFVLAGYMLSYSLREIESPSALGWMKRIVHRYIRLLPMIAVTTILTYFLMRFGMMHHLDASVWVKNVSYLDAYNNFEPTIRDLLYNIFIKTFFTESDYVSPFWTLKYEFFGCIVYTALIFAFRNNKWRRIVYLVVGYGMAEIFKKHGIELWYFGSFSYALGVVVGDFIYSNENEEKSLLRNIFNNKHVRVVLGIIGIYLCCIPRNYTSIYAFPARLRILPDSFYRGIGVGIVLYLLHYCNLGQKILQKDIWVRLGGLSFAIYAVHWPIMLSFETWLFMILFNRCAYGIAAFGAFVVSFVVILGVAVIVDFFVKKLDKMILRK